MMNVQNCVILKGNNLGERHQYLNNLINEACRSSAPLEYNENQLPIDRIFYIGVASKLKNVNYIEKNLKSGCMLYVSKALQCSWLFDDEYSDIINPINLETNLYPKMNTTAVNKMRHSIQTSVKIERRCEEFYKYYIDKDFDLAKNFLPNCSKQLILNEIVKNLEKITPHYLKRLCEKNSKVAKIYYDNINSNSVALTYYLNNEEKYFNELKFLLKYDYDIFFYIMENYYFHDGASQKRLSPKMTAQIMKYHKQMFLIKRELYVSRILDLNILAKYISIQEAKDLIIKLASSSYLQNWFTYKNVEPLIKRIPITEKSSFKTKIFVDKSVSEVISTWPYPIPIPPKAQTDNVGGDTFFSDKLLSNTLYYFDQDGMDFRAMLKKRKYAKFSQKTYRKKTILDKLFDQYRFMSFNHALFELRKKISIQSSVQMREYMMLVLVSKSGGHAENLQRLLEFLNTRHMNEPATVRAAVIRSLCKRAVVWRLSSETWVLFLKYAHGLGLDGSKSEAACYEGYHAVILRALIQDGICSPALSEAFLNNFSLLSQYQLVNLERQRVNQGLENMLLSAAKTKPDEAFIRLNQLLDLYIGYRVPIHAYVPLLTAIHLTPRYDIKAFNSLLWRLFNARIARRNFFKENFEIIQTDASYVNALRHDTNILTSGSHFKKLLEYPDSLRHEKFFRKLMLYFSERRGLAERYLAILESSATVNAHKAFARPITYLIGATLQYKLDELDMEPRGSGKRRLAAGLRANAHVAVPPLDLNTIGWRKAGVKAIANRVLTCDADSVDKYIQKLSACNRTIRIALLLAIRVGKAAQVFEAVAAMRPSVALKVALNYFHRFNNNIDPQVWYAVKPVFANFDLKLECRKRISQILSEIDKIPDIIKIDYCVTAYYVFYKTSEETTTNILYTITDLLPAVKEDFIYDVVEEFLLGPLIYEQISKMGYYFNIKAKLYSHIIAKSLLLCKNEAIQQEKINILGQPFFDRLESLWISPHNRSYLILYINEFLSALKYNKAFLDVTYTSCMPIFKFVIKSMKKFLPVEIWFKKYVYIHLTILYYKSIRQSIKQRSETFKDKLRINEDVELVGTIYGNYIAHEITMLVERYFTSITELYKKPLISYLEASFNYSESKNIFIKSIIKGMLKEKQNSEVELLVEHIFRHKIYCHRNLESESILEVLKRSHYQNTTFFLFANC